MNHPILQRGGTCSSLGGGRPSNSLTSRECRDSDRRASEDKVKLVIQLKTERAMLLKSSHSSDSHLISKIEGRRTLCHNSGHRMPSPQLGGLGSAAKKWVFSQQSILTHEDKFDVMSQIILGTPHLPHTNTHTLHLADLECAQLGALEYAIECATAIIVCESKM